MLNRGLKAARKLNDGQYGIPMRLGGNGRAQGQRLRGRGSGNGGRAAAGDRGSQPQAAILVHSCSAPASAARNMSSAMAPISITADEPLLKGAGDRPAFPIFNVRIERMRHTRTECRRLAT